MKSALRHRTARPALLLPLLVLFVLLCVQAPPAVGQEFGGESILGGGAEIAYKEKLARARSAVKPEELAAAARELSELLTHYPQDVDIPLQLAWIFYRAGRYEDALGSYHLALSRGAGGGEAELGVAWMLFRLGRCREAVPHFQEVLLL